MGSDIDGEAANDYFGTTVSLSSDGTIVAIGADHNDGGGNRSGHVRVYQWNGTDTWTQLGQDIDGEASGDQSGYSLSINSDGTILAIGAMNNSAGGNGAGHVRVYQWNGTDTWTQLGQDIDGTGQYHRVGYDVSLSHDGTILAVGAPFQGSNGTVKIYEWNGTDTWIQLGNDVYGESGSEMNGSSVSLNSNGTILATGSKYGSSYRGHVRIYQWNGTAWTKIGSKITGALELEFAHEARLSGDGSTVIIGGEGYNENTGRTKIYQLGESSTHDFTLAELITGGFNATELKAAKFTATQLKDHFTLSELKAAGFAATELKDHFTLSELITAGFNATELKAANFTATQLKDDFTLAELITGGFTAGDMKNAGFTVGDLKVDYTLGELKTGGFLIDDVIDHYTDDDLIAAGYNLSVETMKAAGKTFDEAIATNRYTLTNKNRWIYSY